MTDDDPNAELRERVREQIRAGRVTVLPRPADESIPQGSGTVRAHKSIWRRFVEWIW